MDDSKETIISTGLSLECVGFIVWLIFLILKCTNNITFDWFWVWFPLWIIPAIDIVIFIIIVLVFLIIGVFVKNE